MQNIKMLKLAEKVISTPGFGTFIDQRGRENNIGNGVFQNINTILMQLKRENPDGIEESEIIKTLQTIPQSHLIKASRGSKEQYETVLEMGFGLSKKKKTLRKELQGASISELSYYSGWLARLAQENTIPLYNKVQIEKNNKTNNNHNNESSGTLNQANFDKLKALKEKMERK
ncbi:hypothetical protein SYNTR_1194 [Candidatus Syntrophocurvum alkaliphilum]|uniref:Uncharacterized protein n=1 Tax=Candidatus Syntrophocurvum alkaliphilum TaxID=2293317 RepID=A0A6I6DFB5_9FIRM|nr:hypothetical protein [Candidatus Syntrophocurvum alkaliphilum]QGT99787.1 hypothetical protein SYNTR_1194 [Candidatus Syntrophocurvum alkaliphilum]